MKTGVAVVLGCLLQIPAQACDMGQTLGSQNLSSEDDSCRDRPPLLAERHLANALSTGGWLRPRHRPRLPVAEEETPNKRARLAGSPVYESAFARAIARAAKRSATELALEAATKVIVMCQKERNPALTTPFFRSDSQQAHCFRY